MKRILFISIAIAIAATALAFIARPKPCTGNVMQDDVLACGLKIGD